MNNRSSNQPPDVEQPDDLIGMALGLLDEPPPVRLFAETSPEDEISEETLARVALIRQSLDLLMDDGLDEDDAELAPPPDLKARAVARLQAFKAEGAAHHEPLILHSRWRWADVAVAASVLFAMFLGVVPAVQRSQFAQANLACTANLLQLWRGTEQYSNTYNVYPTAVAHDPRLPVGSVASLLRQTGHLDADAPLTCPGCRDEVRAGELPHWNEVCNFTEQVEERLSALLAEAYAFHPGLSGPGGRVRHLARSTLDPLRSVVPMVADRPPVDSHFKVQQGNSPAHGGHGQNVIFADGHALFISSRSIRGVDQDVYNNRQGRAEAGADVMDIILMPAGARMRLR
jgi:hypothetical protein